MSDLREAIQTAKKNFGILQERHDTLVASTAEAFRGDEKTHEQVLAIVNGISEIGKDFEDVLRGAHAKCEHIGYAAKQAVTVFDKKNMKDAELAKARVRIARAEVKESQAEMNKVTEQMEGIFGRLHGSSKSLAELMNERGEMLEKQRDEHAEALLEVEERRAYEKSKVKNALFYNLVPVLGQVACAVSVSRHSLSLGMARFDKNHHESMIKLSEQGLSALHRDLPQLLGSMALLRDGVYEVGTTWSVLGNHLELIGNALGHAEHVLSFLESSEAGELSDQAAERMIDDALSQFCEYLKGMRDQLEKFRDAAYDPAKDPEWTDGCDAPPEQPRVLEVVDDYGHTVPIALDESAKAAQSESTVEEDGLKSPEMCGA